MEKLTKEAKEVFDEFMNGYHYAGEDLSCEVFCKNPNYSRTEQKTIELFEKTEFLKSQGLIPKNWLKQDQFEDYLDFAVLKENETQKSFLVHETTYVDRKEIKEFDILNRDDLEKFAIKKYQNGVILYDKVKTTEYIENLKKYLVKEIKDLVDSKYSDTFEMADSFIINKHYNDDLTLSNLKKDVKEIFAKYEKYNFEDLTCERQLSNIDANEKYMRTIYADEIEHNSMIEGYMNNSEEEWNHAEHYHLVNGTTSDEEKEDALTNLVSNHQKHLMKQADDVQNYNSNTVVNEDYKQRNNRRDR